MWSNPKQTAPLTLMAGGETIHFNGMELTLRVTCEIVASAKGRLHTRVVLIGGLQDKEELIEQVIKVQSINWINPYSALALTIELVNDACDWIAELTDDEFVNYLNAELGRPETVITVRGRVIE